VRIRIITFMASVTMTAAEIIINIDLKPDSSIMLLDEEKCSSSASKKTTL
jgi:hypothetical protein